MMKTELNSKRLEEVVKDYFPLIILKWILGYMGTLKMILTMLFTSRAGNISVIQTVNDLIYRLASQTFAPPNLRLLSFLSTILNISIVLFSSSLKRLNALSACFK